MEQHSPSVIFSSYSRFGTEFNETIVKLAHSSGPSNAAEVDDSVEVDSNSVVGSEGVDSETADSV